MNPSRVRELLGAINELIEEVGCLVEEVRRELEEADTAPASKRKTGRGSLLVLEARAPVDEIARKRGRKEVRRLKGDIGGGGALISRGRP